MSAYDADPVNTDQSTPEVGALAPETLVDQQFPRSFRGLRAAAVRDLLARVSEHWAASEERATVLDEQLRRLEAADNQSIDEAALIGALGDHAARILAAARETAAEILAEADRQAAGVAQDIEARTEGLRQEAESLLARRSAEADGMAGNLRVSAETENRLLREQARMEAEATLSAARSEGREMVAEAKAIRERMLSDLSRRRQLGELQIDQLQAGRDRLLDAYDLVRRTLEEATAAMHSAEPESQTAAEVHAPRFAGSDRGHSPTTRPSQVRSSHRTPVRSGSNDLNAATPESRPTSGNPRFEISISGARRAGEAVDAALSGTRSTAHALAPRTGAAAKTPEPAAAQVTDAHSSGARPPESRSGIPQAVSGQSPRRRPQSVADAAGMLAPATDSRATATQSASTPSVAAKSDAAHPVAARQAAIQTKSVNGGQSVLSFRGSETPKPRFKTATASDPKSVERPKSFPKPESVPRPESFESPVPAPIVDAVTVVGRSTQPVDDLFARIRATQDKPSSAAMGDRSPENGGVGHSAADVQADSAADNRDASDESALAQRDSRLEPLETKLTRGFKRALQDEQNEVLDRLRRRRVTSPGPILPTVAEQLDRFIVASAGPLGTAAEAGAQFVGSGTKLSPSQLRDLGLALAHDVVDPLRRRLSGLIDVDFEGSGESAERLGASERLSSVYRQWKLQRLAPLVRHHLSMAFNLGAFEASEPGSAMRWVVDDEDSPCPDCDDNALAGGLTKGEAFPTGQFHPPAHAGCRCLLVPAVL